MGEEIWFANTNPDQSYFKLDPNKYSIWSKSILNDNTELNNHELVQDYDDVLSSNNMMFNGELSRPSEEVSGHLYDDLIRTFGKLRGEFNLASTFLPHEESVHYNRMMRMIMFLHYKYPAEFKYRQTLIDLIIPIYNTVWFASPETHLNGSHEVEALTAKIFHAFMTTTRQIYRIPGISCEGVIRPPELMKEINDELTIQEKEVKDFLDEKNVDSAMLLMQRYLLIFTQSVPFKICYEIWDNLISKGIPKFNKNLLTLCINTIVVGYNSIDRTQNEEGFKIAQKLQDISSLSIDQILSSSSKDKENHDQVSAFCPSCLLV